MCKKWQLEYFWELYEKYVDQIYKFIYLKTYNVELSQDLTSQTFLKALDKISTFKNDETSSFKSWIYRIAYNLVIDDYKTKKESINLEEILEIWFEQNLWKNLDDKEKLKKVFNYFNTLNKKHKEILIMRLWDDLSYKEISEISNQSVDNCKKIVSRTLSQIPTTYMSLLFILLLNI